MVALRPVGSRRQRMLTIQLLSSGCQDPENIGFRYAMLNDWGELGNEMKHALREILVGITFAVVISMPFSTTQAQENDTLDGVALEIPNDAKAGPGFDIDKATDAYINLLSEEDRARSDAYMEGGYWLQLWGALYGLGIAWLMLGTRLSVKMRDLSERLGRWPWLHRLIYGMQYVVVGTVLSFPLTVYQGFFREHNYDLATQTFGSWMGDQFTGLLVGVVLGAVAITLIFGVVRKAGKSWWIWASGVAVAFLMFVNFIAPVYIAPLFNDYKPLEQSPLRDSIMSMANANGIPGDDVYWFDASRQTTRISANVSGALGTTRISLNDNLLNRTSPEEVEAVMAHEMGHYVLNHGTKLTTNFGLLFAFGFAFVAWGFDRALHRWGSSWGVRDIGDTAGLPLFAALLSVFFFVTTPISNGIIRVHEAEADNYAINVSGQPDGFARVAMRLSEYRKISPGPLERIVFYDHPSGRDRVHMSMLWKSEHQDREPAQLGE
jgi:STE24 endopeptidase